MFESKKVVPPVTGWLELNLSDIVMNYLQERIDIAVEEDVCMKHSLAGNISKSVELKDPEGFFMKNVLIPASNQMMQEFPYATRKSVSISGVTQKLVLNDFWVNFQKQHEFNPIHDHGGLFSFVIWVKIPTHFEEQNKLPFLKGMEEPVASNFEMAFTNTDGSIKTLSYLMSEQAEGIMLFFPASAKHAVYPFYECEEERVSISGNIYYT